MRRREVTVSDNLDRAKEVLKKSDERRADHRVSDRVIEMAKALRAKRQSEGGFTQQDRVELILLEAQGAVEMKQPTQGYILEDMSREALDELVASAARQASKLREQERGQDDSQDSG